MPKLRIRTTEMQDQFKSRSIDSGSQGFSHTFEQVVAPAVLGTVPIRIVMRVLGDEALRVRHEAEDAARVILQAGDLGTGAVHILAVKQRCVAVFDVLFSIARFTDEAAFGMGHWQLEILRQRFQEGAGVSILLERRPTADKAARGVMDQAATWQEVQLSQDLETIANAEHVTASSHELLQAIPKLMLGDELGDATAHDVVAIAEATGEDDQLSTIQRRGFKQSHGEDFRREASSFQSA